MKLVEKPMDVVLFYLAEALEEASTAHMHEIIVTSIGNPGISELLDQQEELRLTHENIQNWHTSLQICHQNLQAFQRFATTEYKFSDVTFALIVDEIGLVNKDFELQVRAQEKILKGIASKVTSDQAKRSIREAESTRRLVHMHF